MPPVAAACASWSRPSGRCAAAHRRRSPAARRRSCSGRAAGTPSGEVRNTRRGMANRKCTIALQVTDALADTEPGPEQRVVDAQDLQHAARPADALADMQDQPFRRQASGQRQLDIGRGPAAPVQPERGMRVFGHRLRSEAADRSSRRRVGSPRRSRRRTPRSRNRCRPAAVRRTGCPRREPECPRPGFAETDRASKNGAAFARTPDADHWSASPSSSAGRPGSECGRNRISRRSPRP